MTGIEPVQCKGVVIQELHKRGIQHNARDAFRGILLSSVSGKALHTCYRRRLGCSPRQCARSTPCGGVAGRATDTASLLARAHIGVARSHRLSIALLVIGVTSAFYSRLRELPFPTSPPTADWIRLLEVIDTGRGDAADSIGHQARRVAVTDAGIDDHLAALVSVSHMGT